jgi:uncharacterized protein YbcI
MPLADLTALSMKCDWLQAYPIVNICKQTFPIWYMNHLAHECTLHGVEAARSIDQVIKTAEPAAGELAAAISNAVVRIRTEHHGRGPTRAKTYLFDDIILTVMEEGSGVVERTLAEAGDDDLVQTIRSRVQDVMATELSPAIEKITGRQVRAVVSGSQIELDIDCVVFLLEPEDGQPPE